MASNTLTDQTQQENKQRNNNNYPSKLPENDLPENHVPQPSRDHSVEGSRQAAFKAQQPADDDSSTRRRKEKKLDEFLRQKKRQRKRHITRSEIRAQTEKILEEYLQAQLLQQAIQTSSPEYQRYVDLNVTESTTPTGSSSGFQSSSCALRQDSIPYADESDSEFAIRKAESLPHDELYDQLSGSHRNCTTELPIKHEKSKSAPYTQDESYTVTQSRKRPKHIPPPPPPPPGTPHSMSDGSSGGISHDPVPYTGENVYYGHSEGNTSSLDRHHSPTKKPVTSAPDSLTLSLNEGSSGLSNSPVLGSTSHNDDTASHSKSSDSASNFHTRLPQFISPVSVEQIDYYSSSDSESGKHSTERKTKSFLSFKRAKKKVKSMFKFRSKSSDDEYEAANKGFTSEEKQRGFKKLSHKSHHYETGGGDRDEADIFEPSDGKMVLEDTHVHKNTHIHQTHSSGDKNTILRSTDSIEVIDSSSREGKKHIEKHLNVKESSRSDGGILGKLRRFTSRGSGKKHTKGYVKESKSTVRKDAAVTDRTAYYSQGASVPYPQGGRGTELAIDGTAETVKSNLTILDGGHGFEYTRGENHILGPNTHQYKISQVVSKGEDEPDFKRHSSYLDIVDYEGHKIDRLYFDADGNELPRNKSFDFEEEVHVHETRVDDHGHVRVIRDVEQWDHMETDGDNGDDSKDDDKGLSSMTEQEKEEVYGKIANRLATIGDNFMSEKATKTPRPPSPSNKLPKDEKDIEEEIVKTDLTPLEQEIRDELRRFADSMDQQLADNARTAALRICGMTTYHHVKDTVNNSVDGWAQVALVFHMTKRAIQVAGASGALAMQIKETSLKYIEDRFAGWIIGQGGWDSMLSDDESETDSELD